MLAKVYSGAVFGVEAYQVEIEVNAGHGDPQVVVVGLPDVAVKESRDRVFTALVNSGFSTHPGRVTVNLAPADIKKEGPAFDLPIAVGALAASAQIDATRLARFALIGELALSGEVRRARGVLPIALCAREHGISGLIVPHANAEEAAVVEGIDVFPVRSLRQAAQVIETPLEALSPFRVEIAEVFRAHRDGSLDFSDVRGQEHARRAVEVAVAGGHNILLVGPPGTGKSMIARRIGSVLPEMSLEEALETTRIHSIAGTLPAHKALIVERPFRAPHHTISDAGLLGGGAHPIPGEVSLAHRGVLFLDELPEFHRNVLEVLRQPLEDGTVTISRAAATATFPCEFMLVAAMNPCPCGYFGDPRRECRCGHRLIQQYRNKISGPLLDRIDIHVEAPAICYKELASLQPGESSERIRTRVKAARDIQRRRFHGQRGLHANAHMTPKFMSSHCQPDAEAGDLLKMALTELHFSARAYNRILKVARTIADLAGADTIGASHVTEAIQYRTLDRTLW